MPASALNSTASTGAQPDQAQREAVLGQERTAIHPVGEQHLVAERFLEREAALEDLRLAGLEAAIEPGEDDLDRAFLRPRLGEERRERRPRPRGGADRFGE